MASRAGAGLLALPAIALLLLAAHFLHAGLWPVAVACVAAIGLLWVGRPWAARALQALLALGALEWILTAVTRAQLRMAHGQPYLRLLLILGAVAVFTVLAALAFQHPGLKRRFGLARPARDPLPDGG
jgi:hypothetical protein